MVDELTKFERAYIECALWASIADDGIHLDNEFDIEDIHKNSINMMIADCKDFHNYVLDKYEDCFWYLAAEPEQSGHDFWLTRNHHGAGFWDRGLGEVGRKLTEAADTFGECYLYVGADGQIYYEG